MEAASTFTVAGETMVFTLRRMSEGHSIPPALFVEIIVEKCHLINFHFERSKNHLRIRVFYSKIGAYSIYVFLQHILCLVLIYLSYFCRMHVTIVYVPHSCYSHITSV